MPPDTPKTALLHALESPNAPYTPSGPEYLQFLAGPQYTPTPPVNPIMGPNTPTPPSFQLLSCSIVVTFQLTMFMQLKTLIFDHHCFHLSSLCN